MKPLVHLSVSLLVLISLSVHAATPIVSSQSNDNNARSIEDAYPMAATVGCSKVIQNVMVKGMEAFSDQVSQMETRTCACVETKMRADSIMSVYGGRDRDAKRRLMERENVREYIMAKGGAFSFACAAIELSKAADKLMEE